MKKKLPSFHSTNALHTILMIISSPRICRAAIPTVGVIIRDFFYIQSSLRPKKKRQPYVRIDHPTDRSIPFAPEWVSVYIRFIHLWVFTLTWMYRAFGREASRLIADSLSELKALYLSASSVYRVIQSTTDRPPPVKGDLTFALIHKTDPHLNCLPSLHVMVVTWAAYALIPRINQLAVSRQDDESVIEMKLFLEERARLITESVLYVKQHSTNCIPAALFVMRSLFPGFEKSYGEDFIETLFVNRLPRVSDREAVCEHMKTLYRKFVNEGKTRPFNEVLIEFLKQFPENKD
ncbi:MAG: hypothetical protein PF637_07585 [Spirochaetes bacterium]|jgi:hypothetical protein|nr:hypothetical protein [Spirochaetota bacterium]